MKKEFQIIKEENNNKNKEKIKANENISKEIEEKQVTINRMSACLRLILKDLSKRYETEKNKISLRGMNSSVKEEMAKLGLDEENVGDFIGKDEKINKTSEQIDTLLNDTKKFNTEKAFKFYNNLLENIKELETENIRNGELSFVNFKRSGILIIIYLHQVEEQIITYYQEILVELIILLGIKIIIIIIKF